MEALQLESRRYSKEEYFELLKQSLHKLEYLDGEVRMMSGGSIAHNDTIDNVFTALRVNQGTCKVKGSENAVAIDHLNTYFFPDLTVTCNKPKYEEGGIAKLTNPELIIEVLSESTAEYDRTDKFTAYRQLDSFREYILIDSRRMRIDTFYRETKEFWHIRSYFNPDHVVEVQTLDLKLSMEVIYEGVEFVNN
jgi:Uma2 family endonuclease